LLLVSALVRLECPDLQPRYGRWRRAKERSSRARRSISSAVSLSGNSLGQFASTPGTSADGCRTLTKLDDEVPTPETDEEVQGLRACCGPKLARFSAAQTKKPRKRSRLRARSRGYRVAVLLLAT
jgi:hypothetical protein